MAVNTEPAWYQNMVAANAVDPDVITAPDGPYTLGYGSDYQPNTITLMCGSDEMLKCSPDGFWVRGVKVEQDEREAQAVYEGFKAWMAWAQMTRDYK